MPRVGLDQKKIVELNDRGLTQPEIAAQLGCSVGRIGDVIRKKRPGQSAFLINAARKQAKVLEYGDARNWDCTAAEVAEATGVNQNSVYEIAHRNGRELNLADTSKVMEALAARAIAKPATDKRTPKPITLEDSPEARARKLAAWKKHFSEKAAA